MTGYEGALGLSPLFGAEASNITAVVQIAGIAKCIRAADFITHIVVPRAGAYDALVRYRRHAVAIRGVNASVLARL